MTEPRWRLTWRQLHLGRKLSDCDATTCLLLIMDFARSSDALASVMRRPVENEPSANAESAGTPERPEHQNTYDSSLSESPQMASSLAEISWSITSAKSSLRWVAKSTT